MWTVETVSHVGPEAWTGLGTVVLSQVRCREGKSECGLECVHVAFSSLKPINI